MDVKAVLTVVIATITFMPCGGFLMDTDCPAPPPCTCHSYGIDCRSKGLTSVPIFRVTSARITKTTMIMIMVDLEYNAISTIPNGAFSNLGAFINGNYINLDLSHNHLNEASFSAGAFNGIADAVTQLSIFGNNLTTIPAAVGELHNLTGLVVSSNPIATVDDTVIQTLGHSLQRLYIQNATTLKEFPYVFNLFPNLHALYIDGSMIRDIDICELPPNITLTFFVISDSRLTWIPEMVNDFKSLTSCILDGNMITSLGRHSIRNLPVLDTLRLRGNPIVFVSKCAFLNLPKLRMVDLSGTHLTTIPSALRLLPNLAEAHMENDVSCDCHLHWTNQWDRRNDVSFGWSYCHNISNMKLNDFINTTITQCQ